MYILLLLLAPSVLSCKETFKNTKIRSTENYQFDLDEAIETTVTGCLTSEEFNRTVIIEIKDEDVPVLEEGAIDGLRELHAIILNENRIEVIKPGCFKNVPGISKISLVGNKISKIPAGVFSDLGVKRLLLQNNSIIAIDSEAFKNMNELLLIDLSNNRLAEWNPDWFSSSGKLYSISVTNNKLTELPAGSFGHFDENNNLYPPSIYLSDNLIEKIHPEAFKDVQELNMLDLQRNQLHALENWFGNIKTIKYLLLSSNEISCVTEEILERIPEGTIVTLEENPWDCDCLKKAKIWAKDQTVDLMVLSSSLICTKNRIKDLLQNV